ncbi:ribonuclease H-like domain-containing protein [Tanacetum coccineum]
MRIEQYFLIADYSLWEVIKNGNKVLKRTVGETEQEYEPTTAEEKQDRRNEMKARETLLMALLNKDQLKFDSYKDAKLLIEAIEKRYGGNKESNKVKRTLLKQQYENFAGLSSETMDQTFDSTNSNSSTNEADNTAYEVSVAHTQNNPASGDNLKELEQIDPDDLEEMDLQWEMVMLTIRARRFIKRTGRKLDVNGQRVRFDRSKVECYNCYKYGHFARECRALRNQENRGREINRRIVTVETPTENALVAQDGIGGYDWSYQAEEEHPINFALMAHTSSGSSSSSDSGVDSCSKSCVKAYATLKEQYDSLSSDYKSENLDVTTVVTPSNVKAFESNHESAMQKVEIIPKDKTVSSSTEKIKLVKSARETVEKVETTKQNKHYPRGNQKESGDYETSGEHCQVGVNHKNFANKMTHPYPNRRFVPQTILTRSGKINTPGVSVNTVVRTVNTAGSKPTVNHPRPISNACKKGYSQGNPQQKEYMEKGVIDSGCSRHMTGNKCYLINYEDYMMVVLFLLWRWLEVCHKFVTKKNNVLFTDTECLVLSSDFKLLDVESQVLLRVPRKDNIYNVDLKSVVHTKGLTASLLMLPEEETLKKRFTFPNTYYLSQLIHNLSDPERYKYGQSWHRSKPHTLKWSLKEATSSRLNVSLVHPVTALSLDIQLLGEKSQRIIRILISTVFFSTGTQESNSSSQIDPSWIEALQEGCLQFQLQKFGNCQRLVGHGFTKKQGIESDELDVKSDFLYGTIKEEVYVCNLNGFIEPQFPDKDSRCVSMGELLSFLGVTSTTEEDSADLMFAVFAWQGLWYPRDSSFDWKLFLDSDYAGVALTGIHNEESMLLLLIAVDRDCYEKKLIQVIKIHTDHNVTDLLTKAFDVSSLLDLLNLVAYETIYKEWEDIMERAITTASNLDAEQDVVLVPGYMLRSGGRYCLKLLGIDGKLCIKTDDLVSKKIRRDVLGDMSHHKEIYVNPSHTKKIFSNVKREGKDFFGRVTPLFATTMVQANQEEGVDSAIPTASQ